MKTRTITLEVIAHDVEQLLEDENYDMLDDYSFEVLKKMLTNVCYDLIAYEVTNADYMLPDGAEIRVHNPKSDMPHAWASFSNDENGTCVSEDGYSFYKDGCLDYTEIYDIAKNVMDAINQAYFYNFN